MRFESYEIPFSHLTVGEEHEDHIFEWKEHSPWIPGNF